MAAKLVVEPVFEADFKPCGCGFRPKKSAVRALEAFKKSGTMAENERCALYKEVLGMLF